jgi:hypothetical protein
VTAWTESDAPLALTTTDALLLAHGHTDGATPAPLAAGRYERVEVAAAGRWSLRIVPATP